jgi:hypothetical protein
MGHSTQLHKKTETPRDIFFPEYETMCTILIPSYANYVHEQVQAVTVSSLADFLNFPSTLKMEAIRSSKTSVNTTSTRRHIPEDCFLHSHHRENLKSSFYLTAKNGILNSIKIADLRNHNIVTI